MDGPGLVNVHVHGRISIAPVYMTEVADAVPICGELLGLVRIDPAIVRLVVRICTV